ncbi:type IX secretion system periplasmic lipoprotein PorW/SprE [Reichenbachiella versicolor]|uniref:type IX secretion system periplasmic lipoprotein PorW/SprE n=1 Tax=Reichenbachiella versicolor TaxID=1821036 RepID=UPI0013A5865A|nr:tetratricopeptide repeat protein [Reichenbachiella versicolor]
MYREIIYSLLAALLFLASCAPERNTTFSKTYHNTTAKYNSWFVANEDIKAIEADLLANYDWNYNKVLPIFPQFDTVKAANYQEQLDHCIQKASLAIQYHRGSNWEDNAYILVGKARFYGTDYENAIETFKYVNTKGKGEDEKHEALINLMRTYIEYGEMNNALAVADYLMKVEKISSKNKKDLYLTRSYFYQKREEWNRVAEDLKVAEPLMTNRKERARINFILGQIHQNLGHESESFERYRMVLKNNPEYELSFYTKLNMGSVTQLTESNSLKKVRKYFKKLLKDRKNEEYKDKIYYEYAKFEIRQGNLEIGMDHYNSSVKNSISNDRQKAYSYWALGKIYYDSLSQYQTAKAYYDSTVSIMPQDEDNYETIVARQQVLDNFVTHWTIIHVNDSLLNLVSLDKDSLESILANYIAREEEAENARRKEERRKRRLAAVNNTIIENNPSASFGANNFDGDTWYFYSSTLVSRGVNDFQSNWGDRTLEDYWRLKSKIPDVIEEETINEEEKAEEELSQEEISKEEDPINEDFKMDFSEVMAGLPTSVEQQQALLAEIEEAKYQLGNIYYFELFETKNSIDSFEELLSRFPKTLYRTEVMYQLFLIYSKENNMAKADYYKNKVLNEDPTSVYAKLIKNPNFREDSEFESSQLQLVYKQAYSAYKKGLYDSANLYLDKALAKYLDNDYIDNAIVLKALISGKTEQRYIYEGKLRNFLAQYPESDLADYANSLVKATQDYQLNTINSSHARYNKSEQAPFYFVLVYKTKTNIGDTLASLLSEKYINSKLEIGLALLDDSNTVAYVKGFGSKKEALTFNQTFTKEKITDQIGLKNEYSNFVISEKNFEWFYSTKELDTYLDFYSKNYPLP